MPIVGLTISKIHAEVKELKEGSVSINHNVSIKKVHRTDIRLGMTKHDVIRFDFEFTASYDPDAAIIQFAGYLLFLESPELIKKVEEEWKKNKQLSDAVRDTVVMSVINKCNIEALILSKELNLPPPIPLPSFKPEKMSGAEKSAAK